MQEITAGDKQIRVRATPLALYFYNQEFKTDLIADLMTMQALVEDPTKFDTIKLLQIIWAMNKADDFKNFPSFNTWLGSLDSFDFADTDNIYKVLEEATDGFFRSQRSQQPPVQPRRKTGKNGSGTAGNR